MDASRRDRGSARALRLARPGPGDELLVTNVQAQQRPFTALVDVTYDLETVDDIAVTVRLFLSTDAGTSYPYLCQTVSGDVGAGVLPGTKPHRLGRGRGLPGFSSPTCRLRVTADDGAVEPGGLRLRRPRHLHDGQPDG